MKQLKLAIAGYGKMGQIREKSILESDNTKLISIYDITEYEHHNESIKLCASYEE